MSTSGGVDGWGGRSAILRTVLITGRGVCFPTVLVTAQHYQLRACNTQVADSDCRIWQAQLIPPGCGQDSGLFFPVMRLKICRSRCCCGGTWASLSCLVSALWTTLFYFTRALQKHKIESFSWRRRRRRSVFSRSCTCAFAHKTVRSFFNWHKEKPIESLEAGPRMSRTRTRSLQLLSLPSFFTCQALEMNRQAVACVRNLFLAAAAPKIHKILIFCSCLIFCAHQQNLEETTTHHRNELRPPQLLASEFVNFELFFQAQQD